MYFKVLEHRAISCIPIWRSWARSTLCHKL